MLGGIELTIENFKEHRIQSFSKDEFCWPSLISYHVVRPFLMCAITKNQKNGYYDFTFEVRELQQKRNTTKLPHLVSHL